MYNIILFSSNKSNEKTALRKANQYYLNNNSEGRHFTSRIDHKIPEERSKFVNWICNCLHKILNEIKLREEDSGQVLFAR